MSTTTHPYLLIARFKTLGGAVVEARGNGPTAEKVTGATWICLGCDPDYSAWPEDLAEVEPYRYWHDEWSSARDSANRHAGVCRSMPKPEVAA